MGKILGRFHEDPFEQRMVQPAKKMIDSVLQTADHDRELYIKIKGE